MTDKTSTSHLLNWEPQEIAALYIAGALSPDELAEVQQRIDSGDDTLISQIQLLSPVGQKLFDLLADSPVSPAVRQSVLDYASAKGHAAPYVQNDAPEHWVQTGRPGVLMRMLFADTLRGQRTLMLKFLPGSHLEPHVHPGIEECYVVEGEILTHGLQLRAGDYFRADTGSVHGPSFSKSGCVVLLVIAAADHHHHDSDNPQNDPLAGV